MRRLSLAAGDRRPRLAIGLGVVLALAAALAGQIGTIGPATAAGQEASVEVRLVPRPDDKERPFGFEPEAITIRAGTTVRWVNMAEVFHTVTFSDSVERRVSNGTFDQSVFAAGATVEQTFTTPGRYAYFCQPHSAFMFGTITVTAAPPSPNIPVINVLVVVGVAAVLASLLVLRRRAGRLADADAPTG